MAGIGEPGMARSIDCAQGGNIGVSRIAVMIASRSNTIPGESGRMCGHRDKRLVIGLGTGRCGTVSLARLLSEQDGAAVLHEGADRCGGAIVCSAGKPVSDRITGHLPWIVDENRCRRRIDLLLHLPARLVGDTAFYYLPYVDCIASLAPLPVVFVCLRRDREQTVESFLAHTEGRNHWAAHHGARWRRDDTWDHAFPSYHGDDKREQLYRYWDEYYHEAGRWCERLANFEIFDTDELDTARGVERLFDFVGIGGASRSPAPRLNRRAPAGGEPAVLSCHAVMITVNRVRENYVENTVLNLVAAGFFDAGDIELEIFDSGSADMSHLDFVSRLHFPITVRPATRRLCLVENFARALAAGARSGADLVIFFEDDIEVVPDLLPRIGRFVRAHFDGNAIWSFNAAFAEIARAAKCGQGHYNLPCPAFYGTLCFAIRAEHAASLARWLMSWQRETGEQHAADLEINEWLQREVGIDHVCCAAPCLVQHAGRYSSIRERGFVRNDSFWMNPEILLARLRPTVGEGVRLRRVDEGYELIGSVGGGALRISDSAAFILGRCDGVRTAEQIAAGLALEFGEPADAMRDDVEATLLAAHAAGCLVWMR